MHSSPDCPRCGMSLEPYHTKFHEPFDTYWRCPYCHYSCNADLSHTNWHNILDNEVDWYSKQSLSYTDKLSRMIHIGMDKVTGLNLILKLSSEFLSTSMTMHSNLDSLLCRPTNRAFQKKFNTVYGLTSYQFAKACTLIQEYKPAAQYIEKAMHYVPSDNECFDMVFSLSEEIRQKNQETLAARPADTTPALPATPKQDSPAPTPAPTPMPAERKSSSPGCLVWVIVISITMLAGLYYCIGNVQSSGSGHPAASVSSTDKNELYYVGNRKTKVFHISTCGFVPRISDNHIVEFDDRDEAVSRGYRPCQKCLP